jgi:hypothetical protein
MAKNASLGGKEFFHAAIPLISDIFWMLDLQEFFIVPYTIYDHILVIIYGFVSS